MEDTLRVNKLNFYIMQTIKVLILVLMEDTLRVPMLAAGFAAVAAVLILVLMEDTLRGSGGCP